MSSFHQNAVRIRASQAHVGQRVNANALDIIDSYVNLAPQASQVSTFTVDTGAAATYSWTIEGVEQEYVSAGTDKAVIAAGIAGVINADPQTRGRVTAVSDGVDAVAVTANNPGLTFTISESDSNLSLASTTAADVADAVKAGRMVVSTGVFADDAEQGHVAAASLLTAQVWTFTGASIASGDTSRAVIEVEGVTYAIDAAFDTNNDDSVAALATAINTAMPANTVAATAASGVLTLTSEVAGKGFDAHVLAFGSGGGAYSRTTEPKSAANDILLARPGVTLYAHDEEVDADGDFAYPGNAGMRVLRRGRVWVELSADLASPPTEDVYVYVGSTAADQGKLYDAAGTDRIKLPRTAAQWLYKDRTGGLAAVEISLA